MKKNVTLPSLGVAILDAQINKWLVTEGEKVSENQPIVEVETDKVNFEVVSPINGVILKKFFEGSPFFPVPITKYSKSSISIIALVVAD